MEVVATRWPRNGREATLTDSYAAELRVKEFPIDGWARLPIKHLRTLAVSTGFARYLSKSVADFDIVHIHTLYSFPAIVAARACRRAGVPYIVSPHGSLDPYMHVRKGRRRKEAFITLFHRTDLESAAAVHYVSTGERDLARRLGIHAHIEAVINLAIDHRKYSRRTIENAFSTRHPELQGRRLILYVGRISYSKGLDELVEAFAAISDLEPRAQLVLIGPDYEGYSKRLLTVIQNHGLTGRVTMTGRVSEEEKVAALQAAEIFVLPSYTEAFGLVLLEAMAAGVPIVISRRAAMASQLEQSGACLVADPGAPSLTNAVNRLLADMNLRAQLVAAASQQVKEGFSWERAADEFVKLYVTASKVRPLLVT